MSSPTAAKQLLDWYEQHRRDLPWRRDAEPYRVLVSELMLQQTRVEVVLGYYARFLERFPSVTALAAAAEEDVLAAWSGLGYYTRARRLWAAAREVVARGGWPQRAAELETLPGLGAYTAAAVASIAFGEVVLALDGNLIRVLSRRAAVIARGVRARRAVLAAGAELLACGRPGDVNQALMDLASGICRPRAPRCPHCPLRRGCLAAEGGDPEAFPSPTARRERERVEGTVLAVEDGRGRLLVVRRAPGTGILAGLWEPPWVAARGPGVEEEAARRYGGHWRGGDSRGRLRHAVMHFDLDLEIRAAEWVAAPGGAAAAVAEGPADAGRGAEAGAFGLQGGASADQDGAVEAGWIALAGDEAGAAAAGGASSLVRKVAARLRAGGGGQLSLGAAGQAPSA